MPDTKPKLRRVAIDRREESARVMIRPVGTERSTRVFQEIRELIVGGQLAPGARIVERDLVGRLGASRTPVRSALHRLQQEGYVVSLHGGHRQRLIVTPLTRDDMLELLAMVGALEGIAVRRVARFDLADRRVIVDRLRRVNKALATAATHRRADTRRMAELDETFHRTMFGPGAGARLLAMHETLQPQTYRYRRLFHYSASELAPQSIAEHDEIIAAIERGVPHQAMLAVHKNWNNGSARVGQAMARAGEFDTF